MGAQRASEQHIVSLDRLRENQNLLRATGATTQAGFTAEKIPQGFFARRPILIDDGDEHLEHRKQLVRFFSPRTLEAQHREFIERTAREYVQGAVDHGECELDELALHFSVCVASKIVGLNRSSVPALARRLEAFFRQPEVDHTKVDYGRSQKDWVRAARNALIPLASFYWRDVRPAIRAHRRHPTDDVIGFLIERGYKPREILMECLTYGTAGMVTTREFMSMAMLHLLSDLQLRAEYLRAEAPQRIAILSEIIRLEPPVARIFRRVRATTPECPYDPGSLVDIDVRHANRDTETFGADAESLCPSRNLRASERTGLSFGDGAHRCPGSHLALLETDTLVKALLEADAELERQPDREFDSLVQGYKLRGFTVRFADRAEAT